MWTWFKDLIFQLLQLIEGFCGDWGLAIILITILFRVLISPITQKQFKSTYEMQRIQPKLKELQAKYADDQQKLNEEMMKFYAENKFNPLAGCLPMLLQMPIFIALFQVLSTRMPADASFFGIIPDLSVALKDIFAFTPSAIATSIPYILLVLLFGLSSLLPMLLQKNGDKQTKMIAIYMGVMMLWFGWVSPSGVLIYWDVSSLIGVAQQFATQKVLAKKHEDDAPIEIQPLVIDVERKEKKAKPSKKSKN